jgi:hypothetical protein
LTQIGYQVTALDQPAWQAVATLPSEGGCIITAGNDRWTPPNPYEAQEAWDQLETWLARGNTLIVITTKDRGVPQLLRTNMITAADFDVELDLFGSDKVKPIEGEQLSERTSRVETLWGELTVRRGGFRWSGELGELRYWSDDEGPVLIEQPIGRGSLLLLLDDFAWTNAGLDCGENAAVLVRLLAGKAPARLVAVDEYRHGHGQAESFVTFALSLPGAGSFALIAVATGLLWLWSANVRFGPPEPYEQGERRTAAEYIDAVAELYRRARAAPLAVEAVAERVRTVAHQRGHLSAELSATLNEAEQYVAKAERPVQPAVACRLVGELIRLRKLQYGD